MGQGPAHMQENDGWNETWWTAVVKSFSNVLGRGAKRRQLKLISDTNKCYNTTITTTARMAYTRSFVGKKSQSKKLYSITFTLNIESKTSLVWLI